MLSAQLASIASKQDRQQETLVKLQELAAVHNSQLAEHMRRTEQLETAIQPMQKHVSQVDGAMKLLGLISLLVGVIVAIHKLLA